MRFGLQILLLAALTVFLALQIPRKALFPRARKARPVPAPYASYVELSAGRYAELIRHSRMAWQVRARAAGRLNLEDGTPLVEEFPSPLPPAVTDSPVMPQLTLSAESHEPASLAPPSVAAPPATSLPALEDRRRDSLLDISDLETLKEKELLQ